MCVSQTMSSIILATNIYMNTQKRGNTLESHVSPKLRSRNTPFQTNNKVRCVSCPWCLMFMQPINNSTPNTPRVSIELQNGSDAKYINDVCVFGVFVFVFSMCLVSSFEHLGDGFKVGRGLDGRG